MKQQFSPVWLNRILFGLAVISLSFFNLSCGGDDEVDCDAIEEQLDDLEDDYEDAIIGGDCNDIEDVYDEAVSIFKKGKSCDTVKDIMDDYGADDLDELLDEIEDEKDYWLDYWGC